MKQRINAEYCTRCGGLRSYQEDDVTLPAPTPGAGRIEVYPAPVNATGTNAGSTYSERVCGCRQP